MAYGLDYDSPRASPPDFKNLIPAESSVGEPPAVTALGCSTAFELMPHFQAIPTRTTEVLESNYLYSIGEIDQLLPHIRSCDLSLYTPLYEFKSDTYSGGFLCIFLATFPLRL